MVVSAHTGRALNEIALDADPVLIYDLGLHQQLIVPSFNGELVYFMDLTCFFESYLYLLRN